MQNKAPNPSRQNRSAVAAARQSKRIHVTFDRIPLGKSGVRLQFYEAKTLKRLLFVDFQIELMAIIDEAATRDRMNVGKFIFRAVESELSGQGRATL